MGLYSFIRENGLFSTIEEILVRQKLWDLPTYMFSNLGNATSYSDNAEYLSVVQLAASDDDVFEKFRSNRQYRLILEHVTKSLGNLYLDALDQDSQRSFGRLRDCDVTGGPLRYNFKGLGKFSPTTLRYVYFHNEIMNLFGSLDGFKVLEIGGGFGGQAAVSTTLSDSLSWAIFDLPEVLSLQKRYLGRVGDLTKFSFKSGIVIDRAYGDLLISNYALSEIEKNLQLEYLNKVALNCSRGYMVWNTISEEHSGGLRLSEILEIIPGSKAIDEIPLSSPGNKIIYWGN